MLAAAGIAWPLQVGAPVLLVYMAVAIVAGVVPALVIGGALTFLDRFIKPIIAVVLYSAAGAFALLTALPFVWAPFRNVADAQSNVISYEFCISFAAVMFAFAQRAYTRGRNTSPTPAVPQEPVQLRWKRAAIGMATATAYAYFLATIPLVWEFMGAGPSNREWFAFSVLFVGWYTIPLAAVVAASFIPLFFLCELRGWRNVVPYVIWGVVVALIAIAAMMRGAGASEEAMGYVHFGGIAFGGVMGIAFQVGARVLAPRVLGLPRGA